jgi:hypothetical protein
MTLIPINPNRYADSVSSFLIARWVQLSEPSAIFKPFATWRMSVNSDIVKACLKFGDGTQSTPFDCGPQGDTHVKTYAYHPTAATFASAFASGAFLSPGPRSRIRSRTGTFSTCS